MGISTFPPSSINNNTFGVERRFDWLFSALSAPNPILVGPFWWGLLRITITIHDFVSVRHSTCQQNSDLLCRSKKSVVGLKILLMKLKFGYLK